MGYDSLDDLPLPPPPDAEEEELDNIDLPLPPPPTPEYLQMLLDYGSSLSRPASRKRKRNTNDWQRTKQSKAYNCGKIKKLKGEETRRQLKPPCSHCRRKCSTIFSDTSRKSIFDIFWGMGSKKGRRDFIASHVHMEKKARARGTPGRRKSTIAYTLPNDHGSVVQVCQTMFLNTLDVSEKMVHYNLSNAKHDMVTPKKRPTPQNKTADEVLDDVIKHIDSFPRVESHYCRADSKKEYLEASLNLKEMYRLYLKKQESENKNPCSEFIYRQVFNEQFNIAFHHPNKDICGACTKFSLSSNLTAVQQNEHEAHIRRKVQARESKDRDKNDESLVVAAFDLQQVLTCPKISVSSSYYSRKLNLYNFTILDLKTLQGSCYTWNERECNRGTNDIASSVCMWLKERESEGAKHVVFYSDCCGGQNRNRIMITAILKFLSNSSIEKIEQKFFESGHSKNECDSMHSVIQRHCNNCDIFLPSAYHEHMRKAQHKQPYIVNVLTHVNMLGFAKLNDLFMPKSSFYGILKVHHIVYEKNERGVTVSVADEIGGELVTKTFLKRGKTQCSFQEYPVPRAYDAPCGIDDQKKQDLLKLSEYLPEDCRNFYRTL